MPNELNHGNTILTLDADAPLETPQSKADLIWHEIQNAYRTRKILTGKLGGIEKTEAGNLIAIVYYKDFRAVIPIAEMMLNLVQDASHDYGELALRQNKILNNMLGCEIDFLVKGLDTKTRSIVASRKEAMLKKRQIFYLDTDASGNAKVCEKCKVQGKYAGVVEDIHKGTVFVRLSIGVNAIAHSCYDPRTVGKKDEVSFVVTHIDEERNVAVGLITRIIRQNL